MTPEEAAEFRLRARLPIRPAELNEIEQRADGADVPTLVAEIRAERNLLKQLWRWRSRHMDQELLTEMAVEGPDEQDHVDGEHGLRVLGNMMEYDVLTH